MVERAGSPRGPRPSQAQRLNALGGLVAVVIVVGIAVALAPSGIAAQGASPPSGTVADLAAQGEALFSQSCASCHGMQGTGTSLAPDITTAGAALVDFVLRTGRMPPSGNSQVQMQRGEVRYSDAEIQALVAYVTSLGSGGAPIPSVVIQGADIAHGRELFVANCAACHGPAAGGGAVGGGFVAPPLDQADPEEIGEAVLSGPGQMPKFSFSPDQLNALAGYVTYLKSEPHPGGATAPAVGPVTEGFVAGVALILLLLIARWIGIRQRERG